MKDANRFHQIIHIAGAVVIVASLTLLAVTYRSYRQLGKDMEDEREAAILEGFAYTRRHVSPASARPFFIVRTGKVAWDALAPNAGWAWGNRIERKVLGTFPVPGNRPVQSVDAVTWTDANINLPAPGEYYLHTSLGFFKILYLSTEADEWQTIESVAGFVSRNVLHSLADGPVVQPAPLRLDYQRPEDLLQKFFASDQPLQLYCYQSAEFLGYLLKVLGYETRQVQLYEDGATASDESAKPIGRHVVCEVFLPDAKRWVMLDPDYGAIVRNSDNLLSIGEIATAELASLQAIDLTGKRKLQPRYNRPAYVPPFAWRPEMMTETPKLVPDEYVALLKNITYQYWLLDHDDCFQLVNCRRFARDGTPIND